LRKTGSFPCLNTNKKECQCCLVPWYPLAWTSWSSNLVSKTLPIVNTNLQKRVYTTRKRPQMVFRFILSANLWRLDK